MLYDDIQERHEYLFCPHDLAPFSRVCVTCKYIDLQQAPLEERIEIKLLEDTLFGEKGTILTVSPKLIFLPRRHVH